MKHVAIPTYTTASTTISLLATTVVDRITSTRFSVKVASPTAVCFKGLATGLDAKGSGWGGVIIDLVVLLSLVPDDR